MASENIADIGDYSDPTRLILIQCVFPLLFGSTCTGYLYYWQAVSKLAGHLV
jgi:hypothetical protein